MGKRTDQKELRRQQILHIALNQFIMKGFYGTSTREISRIAGVSSGLMFHYFDSKEALYEALIERGCSKMVFEPPPGLSPIEVFEQEARGALYRLANSMLSAKMFVFMGNAVYNAAQISPKAGEMLARHDIVRQSVPLIEKGQELGQIRPGDPLALSNAFWCSIQGVAEAVALDQGIPLPEVDWIVDILRSKK